MNPLMEEYLIDEHRKDIKREVSLIRLQELSLKSKAFHPNWFTRAMQYLGQWLIAQGEKLVRRYEAPAKTCQSAKQSYAH